MHLITCDYGNQIKGADCERGQLALDPHAASEHIFAALSSGRSHTYVDLFFCLLHHCHMYTYPHFLFFFVQIMNFSMSHYIYSMASGMYQIASGCGFSTPQLYSLFMLHTAIVRT